MRVSDHGSKTKVRRTSRAVYGVLSSRRRKTHRYLRVYRNNSTFISTVAKLALYSYHERAHTLCEFGSHMSRPPSQKPDGVDFDSASTMNVRSTCIARYRFGLGWYKYRQLQALGMSGVSCNMCLRRGDRLISFFLSRFMEAQIFSAGIRSLCICRVVMFL